MNNKLKRNFIYTVCYQVLAVISPLITAPCISRALGPAGVGTYSFVESISSYFAMFAALGISTFGQREISYVQQDINKRSAVFWNVKAFSAIMTIFPLLSYFLFCSFQDDNKIIYILLSCLILSVLLDVSWFFGGIEEFRIMTLRNFVIRIAHVIFVLLFVKQENDLVIYAVISMLELVVSNLSLWPALRKYIVRPRLDMLRPFSCLKPILILFIPTIATRIYLVLDKTMLGLIAGSALENGYYEQAMKLTKVTLTIVLAICTVMTPRIGNVYRIGDKKKIDDLMQKSLRFTFFLGLPLTVGLAAISSHLVPWFFGPGYDKVSGLLQILSVLIIVIGLNSVTGGMYLIATEQEKKYNLTVIIGAVVNFTLNAILIVRFQAFGAAFASVVAETTILTIQIIMIRQEIGISTAIKKSWKYFFAVVAMYAVVQFEKQFLLSSFVTIVFLVGSGAIVYFVFLVMLRDDFFIENVRHTFSKIPKI